MSKFGPTKVVTERLTCKGCSALKTEYWKDYEENDETDSGTCARCSAQGNKCIDIYWYETKPTPEWCPAKESP